MLFNVYFSRVHLDNVNKNDDCWAIDSVKGMSVKPF